MGLLRCHSGELKNPELLFLIQGIITLNRVGLYQGFY